MKNILLITTGGTIASSEQGNGLTPTIDAKEILSYIPHITKYCNLSAISVMSIDSTNMSPKRMIQIVQSIFDNYENYDGFVVTHGTDTMAYTAAALSYMLQNIEKPVVLTGSQISIEAENTDAKRNLSEAIQFACENILGVFVAFNGDLINGLHASKQKTRSIDAFKSINYPIVANIKNNKVTYNQNINKDNVSKPLSLKTNLCEDVFILKIFPGIKPEIFNFIKENYKGVIIESFGIGGIPNEDFNIISKINELVKANIAVVITTQCLYEGIDLNIYKVGQLLAKQKIIHAGDMTIEALIMKLMWALGNFKTLNDIKNFIETQITNDRSY